MMPGSLIACFGLVIAALCGCSTTATLKPAECIALDVVQLRDACPVGVAPGVTPLPGGGQLGSCSVLSGADLHALAAHNGELSAMCQPP